MEEKKKSLVRIIRALHRDIGFLMVGIMIVYSLSGTLLIHRGTNFMKHEIKTERMLTPGLSLDDVGLQLRLFSTDGATTEGDVTTFPNGASYNKATGEAVTITTDLIFPFNKFTMLHKTGGSSIGKIFTTTTGIMLFFLAISSFWMYKPENKNFKRGMILASISVVLALGLLLSI